MSANYKKYDDTKLFALLSREKPVSEKAFAEIYSRYSQRIYAYCLRILGNDQDAGDVFQEAFTKFYSARKNHSTLANVFGFLLRIARNLCLNHKRDKKVTLNIEDFNIYSTDEKYEDKELMELVAASLDLLDFEYREAFVLRIQQGMSYDELEEITGESRTLLKNRVWRAKEKIKTILQPYLEDMH